MINSAELTNTSDTVGLKETGTSSSLPSSPIPREFERDQSASSSTILSSSVFTSFKRQFFLRQTRLASVSTESLVFTSWNQLNSRRIRYHAGCATQPCSQDENSEPILTAAAASAESPVKIWRRSASTSFHGKNTKVKFPTHQNSPTRSMASREIEYGDEDESTQCCSKNIPELKKSALTTKKAEKIASRSLSCD